MFNDDPTLKYQFSVTTKITGYKVLATVRCVCTASNMLWWPRWDFMYQYIFYFENTKFSKIAMKGMQKVIGMLYLSSSFCLCQYSSWQIVYKTWKLRQHYRNEQLAVLYFWLACYFPKTFAINNFLLGSPRHKKSSYKPYQKKGGIQPWSHVMQSFYDLWASG